MSGGVPPRARTLLVELHADNPDGLLQPGAYAGVDFELPSTPDVVRIPTSALIFREHGMEVATIGPGDKIELKPITLGRNLGTEVEVIKGLTLADRVVNSPPDSLTAGDTVHVAGEQPGAGSEKVGQEANPAGEDWPRRGNQNRIDGRGRRRRSPNRLPARHAMALKDFLVYVDQTEDSLVRLRLAVDLAVRNDSRLTAIFVREWNCDQLDLRKAAELGLVSAAGFDSLDRRIETSIDAVAERLRSRIDWPRAFTTCGARN